MARPVKSVADIVAAWKRGLGGAAEAYKRGVAAVTESPMAKAATPEAMDRYTRGVQESVSSGRRAASLLAKPLSYWQQQASTIGAQHLADGATKGAQNYQTAAAKWQPIYQQVRDTIAAMPKGGMANAKARSAQAIEMLMAAAGRS